MHTLVPSWRLNFPRKTESCNCYLLQSILGCLPLSSLLMEMNLINPADRNNVWVLCNDRQSQVDLAALIQLH